MPYTLLPLEGLTPSSLPGPSHWAQRHEAGEPTSLSPYLSQTVPGGKQTSLWGPREWQPVHRCPSMHCGKEQED